jgi:hypothetical protein
MSNTIYTQAKQSFLNAQINLSSDTIKAALVSSAYVPNFATDQFQSAITAATLAGTTDQTLTGKSETGGKFTCSPVTWPAVPNGEIAKYIVFYDAAGGSAGTNRLICCEDTTTGVTLPATANGGDITFTPDASNGLFSI